MSKIEDRLNTSKNAFTVIIELRKDATNTMSSLHDVILKLDEIYKEFIKDSQEKMFIFGLDSLNFQSKMLNIEYSDMNRLFLSINNRMYCEYYKLFKIICEYICENAKEPKILETVKSESAIPQYKDLEPFKEYEFELVQQVHDAIITLLFSLHSYLEQKDYDLKNHQTKNMTGLNIDNFVNTFQFYNVVMREKIHLFINYLEFFHKLHSKYLKRFTTKVHLMHSHVKHDIKLDDNIKQKDKQLFSEMKQDNHEKSIMMELRDSLDDDDTNSSSSVSVSSVSASEADEKKLVDSVDDEDDVNHRSVVEQEPEPEPEKVQIQEPQTQTTMESPKELDVVTDS